jgi:hypothetical protein
MLIVALMGIVAMTVIIPLKFEMQRDQEQEMIHRGVQYTRAIRGYYKKFGRYPTRLEDLENTNNLRYLRKRYKDPLNHNQPFRLLHYGEPGVTMGGSFGGGVIPGATPVGGQAGAGGSAFGSSSAFGNNSSFGNSGPGFGNSGSGFGNSNSAFGNNSTPAFGSSAGVNNSGAFAQPGASQQASSQPGPSDGTSANGSQTTGQPGANPTGQDSSQPGSQNSGTGQGNGFSSSGQPIASGPIVGVASLSKDPTIRLYNKKTKYNEWQFLYDPSLDRGGLITTPYQPSLASFTGQNGIGQPVQNGQPGQPGTASTFGGGSSSFGSSGSSFGSGGSSFGNNSSFGGSSGFGNSGFGSSGSSAPTPPPEPPPTPPQ